MLAHVDFKLGLMHWLSRRPSGHFSHNHSGDIDIFETPIGHSTFYKVLQIFLPLDIPFVDAPFKSLSSAFTGRRCPHSGKGEDFLTGKPDFFTETAVSPERKVEKSFPRSEINRHAEG